MSNIGLALKSLNVVQQSSHPCSLSVTYLLIRSIKHLSFARSSPRLVAIAFTMGSSRSNVLGHAADAVDVIPASVHPLAQLNAAEVSKVGRVRLGTNSTYMR